MTSKTRHISRPIALLLLVLCLLPTGGGRTVDAGQKLDHDSGFLYSSPDRAGAGACIFETLQRTDHEFLEQRHVAALSPDTLRVESVRAAAFLSGEPVSSLTPRFARRSLPARAPPSASAFES